MNRHDWSDHQLSYETHDDWETGLFLRRTLDLTLTDGNVLCKLTKQKRKARDESTSVKFCWSASSSLIPILMSASREGHSADGDAFAIFPREPLVDSSDYSSESMLMLWWSQRQSQLDSS